MVYVNFSLSLSFKLIKRQHLYVFILNNMLPCLYVTTLDFHKEFKCLDTLPICISKVSRNIYHILN